ncbi:broad substrate specificity ATP-binding cassette transporter ABCG2-like isoform X3 [Heptranchias perlo]|uniref:broad substrate specificity ATP-binding cassette transporter ABCG2-like isoform X3 n=1 Tax=Heptranchias perlo TaxID=212740 RepID=UPI00355AB2FC
MHNFTNEEMSQAATARTETGEKPDITEETSVITEAVTDRQSYVTEKGPDTTEAAIDAIEELSSTTESTMDTPEPSRDVTPETPRSVEILTEPNQDVSEEMPVTIDIDDTVVMRDGAQSDIFQTFSVTKTMNDDSTMQVIDGVPSSEKWDMVPEITKYPHGMIVSFSKLSYRLKLTHGYFYRRKKFTKDVLTDISGIMKPGMNAIMGPSGCGKTTLLDILAARKDSSGLTGEVLIDGAQQPTNFNCIAGYVVHDYMMTGTLTVRENLDFSAALRLPKDISILEKERKVNRLVKELGLSQIENSKIGTQFIRGVSAGERKKISIGMELIRDPGVLFLDEPTNGLDASSSNAVLLLLKRLARQGKTIIFSVHQPRYSMFKQFDCLTLLTNGKLMFHGSAKDSIVYFKSIGYKFHSHNNPVDVLLDILCRSAENQTDDIELHKSHPVLGTIHCYSSQRKDSGVADEQNAGTACDRLACVYRASTYFGELVSKLETLSTYSRLHQITLSSQHITRTTSFAHQLKWLCRRIFKKHLGDPRSLIFTVLIVSLLCLILGFVFFHLKGNRFGIHNRTGLLFFIVNGQMYSSISTIELLVTEKKILMFETDSTCHFYINSHLSNGRLRVLCSGLGCRCWTKCSGCCKSRPVAHFCHDDYLLWSIGACARTR